MHKRSRSPVLMEDVEKVAHNPHNRLKLKQCCLQERKNEHPFEKSADDPSFGAMNVLSHVSPFVTQRAAASLLMPHGRTAVSLQLPARTSQH